MKACNVDIELLRKQLVDYVDTELENLVTESKEDAKPTAGFQRVIQRAVIHVQSSGREEVTGANVLIAIFAERESHAAYFLQEQDMTRYDAVNYVSHGIAKRPDMNQPTLPRGSEEERDDKTPNEEPGPAGQKKKQDALEAYCVNLNRKAKEGKIVTRLKGGDPVLFGRGAEEAAELAAAGIRYEIVPGVSSSIAGPIYAGIPVTHRDRLMLDLLEFIRSR
jgi:ATP-dependent Clp protease ATP-binding subunit ClpA